LTLARLLRFRTIIAQLGSLFKLQGGVALGPEAEGIGLKGQSPAG
jgi:hypothetical protein